MGEGFDMRRASVDDVDAMLAILQTGLDSFAEFMPDGWRPPDARGGRERTAELLADRETWALIAEADGSPIGHVSFTPGRERAEGEAPAFSTRPVIPGVAHLGQLFVLPDWWGRGVAPALHDAAIAEMRARGYRRGRLLAPARSPRARRFYERRGWRAAGEEEWVDPLGIACAELWLDLNS